MDLQSITATSITLKELRNHGQLVSTETTDALMNLQKFPSGCFTATNISELCEHQVSFIKHVCGSNQKNERCGDHGDIIAILMFPGECSLCDNARQTVSPVRGVEAPPGEKELQDQKKLRGKASENEDREGDDDMISHALYRERKVQFLASPRNLDHIVIPAWAIPVKAQRGVIAANDSDDEMVQNISADSSTNNPSTRVIIPAKKPSKTQNQADSSILDNSLGRTAQTTATGKEKSKKATKSGAADGAIKLKIKPNHGGNSKQSATKTGTAARGKKRIRDAPIEDDGVSGDDVENEPSGKKRWLVKLQVPPSMRDDFASPGSAASEVQRSGNAQVGVLGAPDAHESFATGSASGIASNENANVAFSGASGTGSNAVTGGHPAAESGVAGLEGGGMTPSAVSDSRNDGTAPTQQVFTFNNIDNPVDDSTDEEPVFRTRSERRAHDAQKAARRAALGITEEAASDPPASTVVIQSVNYNRADPASYHTPQNIGNGTHSGSFSTTPGVMAEHNGVQRALSYGPNVWPPIYRRATIEVDKNGHFARNCSKQGYDKGGCPDARFSIAREKIEGVGDVWNLSCDKHK